MDSKKLLNVLNGMYDSIPIINSNSNNKRGSKLKTIQDSFESEVIEKEKDFDDWKEGLQEQSKKLDPVQLTAATAQGQAIYTQYCRGRPHTGE